MKSFIFRKSMSITIPNYLSHKHMYTYLACRITNKQQEDLYPIYQNITTNHKFHVKASKIESPLETPC